MLKLKNSKKIVIVSSEFPPQPGGIGNHAYNLAKELVSSGYSVYVIADERSEKGLEENSFDVGLSIKVIRIKRYRFIIFTYISRVLKFWRLYSWDSKVIASGKFSLWLVGLFPFIPRARKFAVIHGSEVNLGGFSKKLTDKALKKFNKIIAVSKFTKSLVDGLNLNNIHIISNGFTFDDNYDNPYKKGELTIKAPVLITVGNVTERKGQLNVINALPKLIKLHPGIQYHIVGIPTEQKTFEQRARLLGVQKHITFHGAVNEVRKHELLQESDIFVMLSNKTQTGDVEGFGIAIIEANSLGLPAIGANISGIVDAIENNVSGLLIEPDYTEELKIAIATILKDFPNFSKGAVDWSTQFKWDIIIKKYLKVIE